MNIDKEMEEFISKHSISETLAALCRYCNKFGFEKLFIKLNKIYEWYEKT